MFNKVIMIGNLTRDVDFKFLPTGSAYAVLGLATNRRYKKQDGTQGEEVCFVDVKFFGRFAEVANQYLRKGSKVLIEGKLTYETWTDQTGQKCSRHTITGEALKMLDSRQETQSQGDTPNQGYQQLSMQNQAMPQQPQTENGTMPQSASPQLQEQQSYTHVPELELVDEDIPF